MATAEPAFKTELSEGAFDVREYPALVVAEVTVGGSRDEASNAGFRLLAGYIFGGNTTRKSIPMTAPVVQERAEGETIPMTAPVSVRGNTGSWVVRFVMPEGSQLETMPVPNDPRVHLKAVPPAKFAVVRFSGLAGENDVKKKTAELAAFTTSHHLQVAGAASLARYNPPWTLWFMRRNEVMSPLQNGQVH